MRIGAIRPNELSLGLMNFSKSPGTSTRSQTYCTILVSEIAASHGYESLLKGQCLSKMLQC